MRTGPKIRSLSLRVAAIMLSKAKVFLRIKPSVSTGKSKPTVSVDVLAKTCTIAEEAKGGRKRAFHFDHVLDATENIDTLFNASIKPLVDSCIDGFNISILTMGRSGSGKTFALEGASAINSPPGLLRLVARHLLDSQEQLDRLSVSLRICEVYGDWMRDLLNPANEGLAVNMDTPEGPTITGQSSVHLSDLQACDGALQTARRNRLGDNTDAAARSFVFYVFDVIFAASDSALTKSRLTVVDFCSADLFFADPSRLVMKEGAHVGGAILAAYNGLKHAAQDKTLPAECFASPASCLLLNEFGGNCITSILWMLDPYDANGSHINALNTTEILRQMVSYPVKNDENFLKLMAQHRVRQTLLQQTLLIKEPTAGTSIDPQTLRPDQGIPRRARKASADNGLLQQVADLTERLNAVISRKAATEQDLHDKEQELFDARKMLLDAEVQSKARSEEYSRKITELQDQMGILDPHSRHRQDSPYHADQLRLRVTELNVELSTLQANLQQATKERRALLLKNEELGLELISMVNQKAAMVRERQEAIRDHERLQKHNQHLEARLRSLTHAVAHQTSSVIPGIKQDPMNSSSTVSEDFSKSCERLFKEMLKMADDLKAKMHGLVDKSQAADKSGQLKEYIDTLMSDLMDANERYERVLKKQVEYYRIRSEAATQGPVQHDDTIQGLRKEVKEFVLNTQADLEKERAMLLSKCVALQQQLFK
ncbi:P-loop containing nucleoside triphosphate hydrolase protein [Entophlyctis helioformis]|nr:P-loop containing nucleoside triphosphate hydrolase protein [Entophlyctis helioformis]